MPQPGLRPFGSLLKHSLQHGHLRQPVQPEAHAGLRRDYRWLPGVCALLILRNERASATFLLDARTVTKEAHLAI